MGPRSQRTSERAAQRQKIRDLEALNKEIVRSSAQARQVYFTNLVFAVVAWLLIGVTNSMLFDWVHVDSVRVGVGAHRRGRRAGAVARLWVLNGGKTPSV